MLNKHITLGHAGIMDFCFIRLCQIKKLFKKGMDRDNTKYYIHIQWQTPVPYGSMLHIPPTKYHLLAAKQEPYQKVYILTKKN